MDVLRHSYLFLQILFVITAVTLGEENGNLLKVRLYKMNNARDQLKQTDAVGQNQYKDKSQLYQPLYDKNNIQHYGIIQIGTPPQEFRVSFHTGTSNIWVLSKSCSVFDVLCYPEAHYTYDSNYSSTYQNDGTEFDIKYQTGTLSGYFSNDYVSMQGITIEDQTFGETSGGPMDVLYSSFNDAIFGLGYFTYTVEGVIPPIYNMVSQGIIEKPVFSFDFSTNENQIIFGGSDPDKYIKPLTYVYVTNYDDSWQFNVDKVLIDNTLLINNSITAYFHTGNSVIRGPDDVIEQINTKIGAYQSSSRDYIIDCNELENNNLPVISFVIGHTNLSLEGKDYVLMVENDNCVSGFQNHQVTSSPSPNLYWILGDIFIRRYYTVFDLKLERIGFANYSNAL